MSIIVSGATGHLGRLVVEALLRRGVPASDLVATGRDTDRIKDLAGRGVTVRRADFQDPERLAAAFDGGTRLLLVSTTTVGERIGNHRRAIDAARAAGIQLIVYTSAVNADTARMRLAVEHRQTEEHLRASGVDHVVLRNGWYLDNYLDLLPAIRKNGTVAGSAGPGAVSAAVRADYAEAAAVVLTTEGHAGATYELGGEAFTLPELAAAISAAAGEPITYSDLPAPEYARLLVEAGLPTGLAEVLADADLGLARGELYTSSTALAELIGHPPTTLAQALARVV
jgi:NAD(P)H dehydrogenase (quinone)